MSATYQTLHSKIVPAIYLLLHFPPLTIPRQGVGHLGMGLFLICPRSSLYGPTHVAFPHPDLMTKIQREKDDKMVSIVLAIMQNYCSTINGVNFSTPTDFNGGRNHQKLMIK